MQYALKVEDLKLPTVMLAAVSHEPVDAFAGPSHFRCDLLWLFSRWPQAELGLDTSGEGGGTVVSSCWTIFIDRWFRGLDAAAWNAFVMSSVEKESMRGRCVWLVGMGIVEVIFM